MFTHTIFIFAALNMLILKILFIYLILSNQVIWLHQKCTTERHSSLLSFHAIRIAPNPTMNLRRISKRPNCSV